MSKTTVTIDDGIVPDGCEPVRVGHVQYHDKYIEGNEVQTWYGTPELKPSPVRIIVRQKEPSCIPLCAAAMLELVGKPLRYKDSRNVFLVTAHRDTGTPCVLINGGWHGPAALLQDFEHLDGSCVGHPSAE